MSQRSFCIYKKLFRNSSQRTVLTLSVKNLNIQKWHVYYNGCQGRNTSGKSNFIFTRKKIDEEQLLLMIAQVTYS